MTAQNSVQSDEKRLIMVNIHDVCWLCGFRIIFSRIIIVSSNINNRNFHNCNWSVRGIIQHFQTTSDEGE